jgi:predicted DNA-binding mobile mystery protein A
VLEGLEQRLAPLAGARASAGMPARGWLRAIREAVGFTQGRVAARAGVKRQTYAQLELAEETGSISVASLRRAAAAMDCELVYFLLPREAAARTFAELARSHDPSSRHLSATDHSTALDGRPDPDDVR